MLIGSAIILALSLGVRHGFGLYLVPMSDEFGWGHNVFSLAIAMQNLIWGAAQPFTGALADKYGSKIVVAVGGVLYTIGLLLMAVSSTGWLLNLSVGLNFGPSTYLRPLSLYYYPQWVVLHLLKSVALLWVLPVQQALWAIHYAAIDLTAITKFWLVCGA